MHLIPEDAFNTCSAAAFLYDMHGVYLHKSLDHGRRCGVVDDDQAVSLGNYSQCEKEAALAQCHVGANGCRRHSKTHELRLWTKRQGVVVAVTRSRGLDVRTLTHSLSLYASLVSRLVRHSRHSEAILFYDFNEYFTL